ncbi:cation:proton antiporter [Pseudomonas sp. CFBP 8770]|uniref:cation:proton antiporter n=1 Tax=unclassified Pseudomonas TaxID=196821 RepID=UPI001782EF5C|nr:MULTISPECIES: cation:proton antiporter [unclassified Pseudomonas]MBD8473028.1 cation:proton antiporter [Pseudomonas sp. CFBP 8773]MBD8645869.1 cation:proton antiporter [Pseudomonas sp. CFBP 8770]
MSFILWMAVLGVLLLMLALTASYLRWLPVTTSAVCLAFGVAIGPMGLGLFTTDFKDTASWLERLAEAAVLFSLFSTGIKLRLSLGRSAWRAAYMLSGPVMLVSILGVCLVAHYGLGLSWGVSTLLGAMLAPTDPVLASMVQVNSAQDFDRVRFGLSGEAGLNDGTAFPFVILSLLMLHHGSLDSHWLGQWALENLLWGVPVGLLVGYGMGRAIGHLMIYLRVRNADSTNSPNDFLALALIALSYFGAASLGAFGFLAVFAAGLGLRQAEVRTSGSEVPSEHLAKPIVGHRDLAPEEGTVTHPKDLEDGQLAAGVMMGDILVFGNLVERSMEVLLITILGATLSAYWDWRAVGLAAALFCVIRPLSVWLLVSRRLLDGHQRALLGWFGIRGIGSIYYLCYALAQELPESVEQVCISLTLSVVALSILVHGISTQPLLEHYERRRKSV